MDISRSQIVTIDVDGEECVGIVVRADEKDNEDGSRHCMATVFVPREATWIVWEGPIYANRGDARTAGDDHGRATVAYVDPSGDSTAEKGSQSAGKTPPKR